MESHRGWTTGRGYGPRRVRGWFSAWLALTLLLLLLVAGPALAATTFQEQSPASNTYVSVGNPLLSVKALDPAGLYSSPTVKLNGLTVRAKFTYIPGGGLITFQPTALAEGTHTVYVSMLNFAGKRSSVTWSFKVEYPPQLSSPAPQPGSRETELQPMITVSVANAGADPTVSMTLNGDPVPAVYDPVSKALGYRPDAPLKNGRTYRVEATVSRPASGGSTTLGWSFYLQTYPEMPASAACASCHAGYPTPKHSTANCAPCHAQNSPVGDCASCHGWDQHGPELLERPGYTCTLCHQANYQATVPMHLAPTGSYHQSVLGAECESCHEAELTVEHNRRFDDANQPLDCLTCHQSQDPAVSGAVRAKQTGCAACHQGTIDHSAVHDQTFSDASCGGCHQPGLTAEHLGRPGLSCETCHGSQAREPVKAAVQDGAKVCSACHSVHSELASAHTLLPSASDCVTGGCHTGTDLTVIHEGAEDLVGGQTRTGCLVCHAEATPATKDCATCHPQRVEPHGADPAAHTAAGPCVTSGCHSSDVTALHGTPGCASCHGQGKMLTLTCASCHTGEQHPAANHVSNETCGTCHAVSNLVSIHASNCATCHPSPRNSFDSWSKTCEQSGCHAAIHAFADAYHVDHGEGDDCFGGCHFPNDWYLGCSSCHRAPDSSPPLTTSNAQAAYFGAATIRLTATDNSSGVAATYYQLDGGALTRGSNISVAAPAAGTKRHTLEFWSIDRARNSETHRVVNFTVSAPESIPPKTTSDVMPSYTGPAVITLAASDEGGSGVANTYYQVDGGAQKTGTTITVPAPKTGTANHTIEFWSVDGSGNQELPHNTATFSVDALPDDTAPTTTSDAKPAYSGTATIRLTATDDVSGVERTYYSLDGGAQIAGTTVTVSAPSSGTISHSLEFWSVDYAGNVETPRKSVTFDVTAVTGTTGTIQFAWDDPPAGSWAYYSVYDADNKLVSSGYGETGVGGWDGWFYVSVPVSARPYRLETYWNDTGGWGEDETLGTALIDTPGKVVTFWY